jgi:rod shape-determining protein MreC
MIITSIAGTIAPVEGVLSIPLNFMAGISSSVSQWANNAAGELAEIQSLRDRNAELEEALARFQAELVQQREIVSDYQRLVNLLEYTTSVEDQEFVTADVISYDPSARIRTIIINRGTRNGIEVGMPVVTDQGLVGRITAVTANAARVLLLTDESSFVSARLQNSRAQGSVQGLLTGGLRMIDIPLDAALQVGDIVLTSGLGGNFPADQVIGQVESIRQFEFELGQEAEVRSLIDFDTLELVMVVTSFRPVDLSVFEEDEEN